MTIPSTMKAWRIGDYTKDDPKAGIDALKLETDVPVPTEVKEDQVLVKVKFASVNPIDWKLFSAGLHAFTPCEFPYSPGFDIAGEVVKAGSAVTNVTVGDTIIADIGLVESCTSPAPYGGAAGAFAEYATCGADLCCKVAAGDLKSLVGLPLAGLTSYQALFTGGGKSFAGEPLGDAKEGSKVLILGAAGGTGTLAIQMAKAKGCTVAVTASSTPMPDDASQTKIDFVKSLGADIVIDYKTQDWAVELAGQDYDVIYDCVGAQEDLVHKAPKVLKKGGTFVSIANFDPSSKSTDAVRFANFLIASDSKDLYELLAMVGKGQLKVLVDSEFEFSQVKEALHRSIGGRSVGKIVIKIAE